ncbi:uncharacterized protein LOC144145732 [Haemaphysalis longicornis]
MWEDLAAQVNEEFTGSEVTPAQVENKWRTMERAWNRARTANRRTGAARQTCEYERELTEVLEKEHAANPTYLAGPGRIRRLNDAGELADADRPGGPRVGDDATEQQEEEAAEEDVQPQQPPPVGRAARRVRQDHTRALIQRAIGTIEAAEADRRKRHEERLAARREAEEAKKLRHQQLIAALDRGTGRIAAAIEGRRVFYPDT